MYYKFGINEKLIELSKIVENKVKDQFAIIEEVAEYNQLRVIKAMQEHRISEMHFQTSTGYGHGDIGREAIDSIYAQIFGTESALVRTQFVSGTHAINAALWSCLRPGDILLAATGEPYDSLEECIGIIGEGKGSLEDFGIKYNEIDLKEDGSIDYKAIEGFLKHNKVKMMHIQRSKGYTWRPSFDIDELQKLIAFVKNIDKDIVCLVDNCYGEFVETKEPTMVGADLVVGSLIKNPGGGMAKTGGYIAGRKDLIELAAYRMTAPGIGREYGATMGANRDILMGLFMAPGVVAQSLKGAVFAAELMTELGFEVYPAYNSKRTDIIQSIKFNDKHALICFCQGIQKGAAVDAHVNPEPSEMPGYADHVIMAAGTFVQGASIEMSCDAPIREPYIGYLQGGLTYTHAKLSILMAVQELMNME